MKRSSLELEQIRNMDEVSATFNASFKNFIFSAEIWWWQGFCLPSDTVFIDKMSRAGKNFLKF